MIEDRMQLFGDVNLERMQGLLDTSKVRAEAAGDREVLSEGDLTSFED
jgi:hypothetical protein